MPSEHSEELLTVIGAGGRIGARQRVVDERDGLGSRVPAQRALLHLIQPDDVGACAALAQALAALDRWPGWLALLFVDIDGLRIVNDSLGHDAGIEMLRETARRLQSALRSCDTLARIGGDELLVVVSALKDVHEVGTVAQRLIDAFSSALRLGSDELPLTASIGAAATSHSGTASQELVRRADVAMYRAKARDGGCWVRFDERLADEVEALVRWQHPVRGLIGSADRTAPQPARAGPVAVRPRLAGDGVPCGPHHLVHGIHVWPRAATRAGWTSSRPRSRFPPA